MPDESLRSGLSGTVSAAASVAASDARWMREALRLAEASVGLASPNPRVGCVLVKNGTIVGRGEHHYDRLDHAEIVALRQAGEQARGATAYVTLEPCAHIGRTGPCAEALIAAGVSRVVVATGDPFPEVNGRGLALLREAGIDTEVGVLAEAARALNDGFACRVRRGLPFVTLKAGVSLDGRVAPGPLEKSAGSVAYITGARSLLAVQKMRHASDAVLTGIGTVLEDDPLLTDRSGGARRRPLLRVVLDSHLRLPLTSRVVATARNDVLVCTGTGAGEPGFEARCAALQAAGVEVRKVATDGEGRIDVSMVLRILAEERSILNVLAECGPHLARTLLGGENGAQHADRLTLFYAPLFLGEQGVPLVGGDRSLPIEVSRFSLAEFGSDFRLDAYLRNPWSTV